MFSEHNDPATLRWDRLRVADVRRLPFADDAFDAASAAYLLHLLDGEDVHHALAEIRRVLRPGGRLVTATPAIPPGGIARPIAALCDRLAARWPGRFAGLGAFDPRSALVGAGFSAPRACFTARGYPSISVLAIREPTNTPMRTTPRIALSSPAWLAAHPCPPNGGAGTSAHAR